MGENRSKYPPPLTFLNNSCKTLSSLLLPSILSFILVLPPPIILLPCYFLLKIAPRLGILLGGSPPSRALVACKLVIIWACWKTQGFLRDQPAYLLLHSLLSPCLHLRHQAFSHAAVAPRASTCHLPSLFTLPQHPWTKQPSSVCLLTCFTSSLPTAPIQKCSWSHLVYIPPKVLIRREKHERQDKENERIVYASLVHKEKCGEEHCCGRSEKKTWR